PPVDIPFAARRNPGQELLRACPASSFHASPRAPMISRAASASPRPLWILAGALLSTSPLPASSPESPPGELRPRPLVSQITRVQPMTGIVLWDSSSHRDTDAIQLEFSY